MIATNFSNARNNLKKVCDKVVEDADIAIITRKNDENVVLMSQQKYDNLMENAWKDYLYWQKIIEKKFLQQNKVLGNIERLA